MSLRTVLDALLVEFQGYLTESSLLAVCPLAHRREAYVAHLFWFVNRVRMERAFLTEAVGECMCVLDDARGWHFLRFPVETDRVSLEEYAETVDRAFDHLRDALRAHVRLSSDA